jgi:D-alanyl-D-alanine carboxypeptidase
MALCSVFLCGGLTMQACAEPAVTGRPAASQWQTCLEEAAAEVIVPGAIAAVVSPDGHKWNGAVGVSEITAQVEWPKESADTRKSNRGVKAPKLQGRPMDPSLGFQSASILKTLVATLVLMLDQQGILHLDDTVESWYPDLLSNGHLMTIRNLLNHTSGLACYTDNQEFFEELDRNPHRKWQPRELIGYALNPEGGLSPGQGWAYSDTNYLVLGLIIEKATGEKWPVLLKDRIMEPLGLKDTFVPESSFIPGPHSHGYRFDFQEPGRWHDYTDYADPSWMGAAGALVSTADDLLTWLGALLAGRLLDERHRELMFQFEPTGRPNVSYGLGLGNWNGAVGHGGDYVFGFQTGMYRYRGYDFVIMTNGPPARLGVLDGPWEIFSRMARLVTRQW